MNGSQRSRAGEGRCVQRKEMTCGPYMSARKRRGRLPIRAGQVAGLRAASRPRPFGCPAALLLFLFFLFLFCFLVLFKTFS
jgi:hypothetical protein